MLHEHVYVYISIFIMWVYNNQPPPQKGKKEEEKKNQTKTNSPLHPSRPPPPKLPKISVVNKSPNEEGAFELRSQVEEICQYWSVCL